MISSLAENLGVGEDALRLIFALIYAYPILLLHRLYLKRQEAKIQHFYFALTGMVLAYWAFGGICVAHSLICVLVTYITLTLAGRNFNTACFLFIFQLGYLAVGYISTTTSNYVVNWTMPHCVLCLRLIGTAVDCYDGSKPEADLSKQQLVSGLPEVPSLLEMTSHVFYPAAYFVGPQFSMDKYRKYIVRNIEDGDMTGSISFGLRRFMLGFLYFGIHIAGGVFAPTSYVVSEEFASLPIWKTSVLLYVWCKGVLAKYLGAWLISEGACVVSGLAYGGVGDDGTLLWNDGANVRLRRYESCFRFGHVIESFNINTNVWCMNYIYKRCRFLNNKLLSQLVTMFFLAVWHGFHSGYYLCFFHELLVMNFEKQFFAMVERSPIIQSMSRISAANTFFSILGYLYVAFFLPHCLLPFVLLKSEAYLPMIWTTKAPVFLFFGTWPIWRIVAKMILKPEPSGRLQAQKQE